MVGDVNGYKNPVPCPYTKYGDYKPGIVKGDPSIDKHFDYKTDWNDANPFPVIPVEYHNGWILAIPSSTIIESGYPEYFDPTNLIVSDQELKTMLAFCKEWDIETSEPRWLLSSL